MGNGPLCKQKTLSSNPQHPDEMLGVAPHTRHPGMERWRQKDPKPVSEKRRARAAFKGKVEEQDEVNLLPA